MGAALRSRVKGIAIPMPSGLGLLSPGHVNSMREVEAQNLYFYRKITTLKMLAEK